MATHQDLLDAINRVRAATGDRDAWHSGLSGDDIAAACNPFTPPADLGAVLTKIVASHPDAFVSPTGADPPPRTNTGAAANAIREAETALAHQNSAAAQVDLQVVTAVLNAHAANADGAAELDRLQREIEAAVQSRTDLDTPAGAREFQRFLIGKLREIRAVVDSAGLDATSKAALAVALASLYASATPEPAPPTEMGERAAESQAPQSTSQRGAVPESTGLGVAELQLPPEFGGLADSGGSPWDVGGLPPEPMAAVPPPPEQPLAAMPPPLPPAPAPVMAPPPMAPPAMAPPAWGGGAPFGGGGLPTFPELGRPELSRDLGFGGDDPWLERDTDARRENPDPEPQETPEAEGGSEDTAVADAGSDAEPTAADPNAVELPDGQIITAASPALAAAITAAVAGTSIPEAFRQQGIVLPPPGSPVVAPLDAATLTPGDIGVLTDRHALALGNGTALLDNQIQPIASVPGPGFLGWQHPPGPTTTMSITTAPQPPAVPAPTRPAETAPS